MAAPCSTCCCFCCCCWYCPIWQRFKRFTCGCHWENCCPRNELLHRMFSCGGSYSCAPWALSAVVSTMAALLALVCPAACWVLLLILYVGRLLAWPSLQILWLKLKRTFCELLLRSGLNATVACAVIDIRELLLPAAGAACLFAVY